MCFANPGALLRRYDYAHSVVEGWCGQDGDEGGYVGRMGVVRRSIVVGQLESVRGVVVRGDRCEKVV